MVPFSLHEIAPILDAQHIGSDCIIRAVTISSHLVQSQCMFIALIGQNFDGHDFAEYAVMSGACALLVNHYLLLDVPQLVVFDTRSALMKLAHWIRHQILAKLVIITGSSGKTTVKEMVASILNRCGQVISTQGNYNNAIGVPMTLLRLSKKDNFAVIELGVSNVGEMKKLIGTISADVALINNIYPSHLLGFKSLLAIAQEKGDIFLGLSKFGKGVINADSCFYKMWNKLLVGKIIWSFSLHKKMGVDFFSSNIVTYKYGTRFFLHTPFGTVSIFLSMLGRHNVSNALAASALALSVGASLSEVVYGLESMQAFPGRLFPIMLKKNKLLLDDTYNSNVGSMLSAIHVLDSMPGYRVLVTSDMLELGDLQSIEYHRYVGLYIRKKNIDQVLTIGDLSYLIFKFSKKNGKHFRSQIKLFVYIQQILLQYELMSILIKGSRSFKMEKIIRLFGIC